MTEWAREREIEEWEEIPHRTKEEVGETLRGMRGIGSEIRTEVWKRLSEMEEDRRMPLDRKSVV